MKLTRTMALVAAALVLGLVAGTVATAAAATDTSASTTATATGMGLRLGGAMRDAGGRLLDVVAKLTGLSTDDVQAQRTDGKSFADIAATKKVSSQEVVDAALKVREQVLADRVASGAITEAQAAAALDRMETRLTERVASTDACTGTGGMGGGMMGGGGRGGRGGRGGMGGGAGACGGTCTQAPVTQ